MVNGFRLMLVAVLAGSALALSGCGKAKDEKPKAAVAHTDDDGDDHSGHNH